MNVRYKFHAIAIAAIIGVVSLASIVIGPATSGTSSKATALQQIILVSATWGANCNEAIAQAQRTRESTPLPRDAQGQVVPQPALVPVLTDNVHAAVSELCEGKPSCRFVANSKILGTDPLTDCYKQLQVSYRCFDLDRLNILTLDQGSQVTIDCNPTPATSGIHGKPSPTR
jgi:hypothetical protein